MCYIKKNYFFRLLHWIILTVVFFVMLFFRNQHFFGNWVLKLENWKKKIRKKQEILADFFSKWWKFDGRFIPETSNRFGVVFFVRFFSLMAHLLFFWFWFPFFLLLYFCFHFFLVLPSPLRVDGAERRLRRRGAGDAAPVAADGGGGAENGGGVAGVGDVGDVAVDGLRRRHVRGPVLAEQRGTLRGLVLGPAQRDDFSGFLKLFFGSIFLNIFFML